MARLNAAVLLAGFLLIVLAFALVDMRLGLGVAGLLLIFGAVDIRRAV
jgi:hypothetical protein